MTMRLLIIALMVVAAISTGQAQTYPTRPVTVIVPYPAGGPTDQVARQIAPKFAAKLGQNFVVENVSGGGTNIAGQRVARSAPYGYTLFVDNLQVSANVSLYKSLPFDTEKDLLPIAMINSNPLVLVGRKTLEAKTLPELVAWMKTRRREWATRVSARPAISPPRSWRRRWRRLHAYSLSWRRADAARHARRPYRFVLRDAAAGGRPIRVRRGQGVRHHIAGYLAAVPGMPSSLRPMGRNSTSTSGRSCWRRQAPKPIADALDGALQDALDDPEILKVGPRAAWRPIRGNRTPAAPPPISTARSSVGVKWCATTRSKRQRISGLNSIARPGAINVKSMRGRWTS